MNKILAKFISFGTGSGEVNARVIPANFTPSNYTPAQIAAEGTDKTSAHLKGIDTALGASSGGSSGEYTAAASGLTGTCTRVDIPESNTYYWVKSGNYVTLSGRLDIFTNGVGQFSFELTLPTAFANNFTSENQAHGNFISTGSNWFLFGDYTITAWSGSTTYAMGAVVRNSTGDQYISLVSNNLNHAVTDTAYWNPYPITGFTDYTNAATNSVSVLYNYLFGYSFACLGYVRSLSGTKTVRFVGSSSATCLSRNEYVFMAKVI